MPHFEEEDLYCFEPVGPLVSRCVRRIQPCPINNKSLVRSSLFKLHTHIGHGK